MSKTFKKLLQEISGGLAGNYLVKARKEREGLEKTRSWAQEKAGRARSEKKRGEWVNLQIKSSRKAGRRSRGIEMATKKLLGGDKDPGAPRSPEYNRERMSWNYEPIKAAKVPASASRGGDPERMTRQGIISLRNKKNEAVELGEMILPTETYKWWKYNGPDRRLAYRAKIPHYLHPGDIFGIRQAHSNPDKIRLVVKKEGYGITKVFSISKEEAWDIANRSSRVEVNEARKQKGWGFAISSKYAKHNENLARQRQKEWIPDEAERARAAEIKMARQTLNMPEPMLGVMGGQTKDQARAVLKRYGLKETNEGYEGWDKVNKQPKFTKFTRRKKSDLGQRNQYDRRRKIKGYSTKGPQDAEVVTEAAKNQSGTFKIVRIYRDNDRRTTIKRGLSLAQAQAHCKDRETSSSTCTNPKGKARARKLGPWFDSYSEE